MNEAIVKAHQTAQLFTADLREAYKIALDNVALDELLTTFIRQAAEMERILGRLAEESQK